MVVTTGHPRGRQIDGDTVADGQGFHVTVLEQALAVRVPSSQRVRPVPDVP